MENMRVPNVGGGCYCDSAARHRSETSQRHAGYFFKDGWKHNNKWKAFGYYEFSGLILKWDWKRGIEKHPYAVVHGEWYSKLHVQGQQITIWKPVYCLPASTHTYTHSPWLFFPFLLLGNILMIHMICMLWQNTLKSKCETSLLSQFPIKKHFCCIKLTKLKWMSCNLNHDCELLIKQVSTGRLPSSIMSGGL